MDFNLFLKFFILSTEFFLFTVCLYNTPWYIRNHIIRSKDGKSAEVSIINFVHIPNKMLLKKPIGWLTAPSVKECRTQCTTNLQTCISFNARRIVDNSSQTTRLHCDFFDDDHYANQLFFIDADDVDYYAPKVNLQLPSKNISIFDKLCVLSQNISFNFKRGVCTFRYQCIGRFCPTF